MRNPTRLRATLLCCLVFSAWSAWPAEDAAAKDRVTIGGSVRQAEPVSGDMVGVGGDVELAASVAGNGVLAGGNVVVRESVGRDLIAGGGNVTLEASVARNARLAGGNVEITPKGSIAGKLSVAGGTVQVRGPVGGSIDAAAGDLLIDAAVGGDVRVAGGSVELGPNARIAGRLLQRGWIDVRRDPAAQVAGGIERREPRHESRDVSTAHAFGWAWSITLAVIAAVIAGAFPAIATRLGANLRDKPGLSVLLGFAVLACVPATALLLGITIIGIPIAVLLLVAYGLLLIVAYASAGVLIGDAALARVRAAEASQAAWRAGAAAVAVIALALLGRVPFVGWLFGLAALLAGIGAIVVTVANRHAAPAAA
jgi:hypothetical protein